MEAQNVVDQHSSSTDEESPPVPDSTSQVPPTRSNLDDTTSQIEPQPASSVPVPQSLSPHPKPHGRDKLALKRVGSPSSYTPSIEAYERRATELAKQLGKTRQQLVTATAALEDALEEVKRLRSENEVSFSELRLDMSILHDLLCSAFRVYC